MKEIESGSMKVIDKTRDDMVNDPPHYNTGSIECIDAIQAALTPTEFRGYCKGNNLKYTWREHYKGEDEDLKKAAWYLDRLLKSIDDDES
ncbi:MAG: hypothetical protein CM15mV68_470 [uncultured marine virus]|nr:MAG: hypothetical protein CM15mV68_470 [uncultured marine virus]